MNTPASTSSSTSTSFPIFLFGYVLIGAGLLYGMHAIGLSSAWLISVGLIFAGTGLITAFSRARSRTA